MNRFDQIYQGFLSDIMTKGFEEVNVRTNHKTRALPGLTFSLDIEKEGFPLLSLRKIPISTFVAEQAWFITGSRKPDELLRKYTKIWDAFTNPQDVVTVAYGYRWRKHFGRDQLGLLVEMLKKDPSSRHGVVVMWDPAGDGLGGTQKKNVPCPYTFTVNIIGGKLHMHLIVRSNDMILGFPHDVAGFALLQCLLAQELGVTAGTYTHSISNAHVYDIHFEAAEEIIKRKTEQKPAQLTLPQDCFKRFEQKDTEAIDAVIKNLQDQYTPCPPIKGLEIVL